MSPKFVYIYFLMVAFALSAQDNSVEVGPLPSEIFESSGLIFFNDHIITHNDSGNEPVLFEIDTLSLGITRTIRIENATNVDWEDITQDDAFIYVGDIGNNSGNRQDLTIYKIDKADFLISDMVTAERIDFAYEDQTIFSPTPNSEWDAEALIHLNGELIVFKKQWQTTATTAYSIPLTPGSHSAQQIGSYEAMGLVTAATFNIQSNVLFLLGYSPQLQPFVLRIEDITTSDALFSGSITRTNLNIGFAQAEGITFSNRNRYYISTEQFINANPPITLASALYSFETNDTAAIENPGEEPNEGDQGEELLIYRSFGSNQLMYELETDDVLFGRAIFDPLGRIVSYTQAQEIDNNAIDVSTLQSSVYYLTFYFQKKILSEAFILE